jgi:hypothetical protein
VGELNRWFEQKKDQAIFRIIYIAEAHATDKRQSPENVRSRILVATHKTMAEREAAAKKCAEEMGLKAPILMDDMDDKVSRAYGAWPDRLYVVDAGGRIAYSGAKGPAGFKPPEAQAALDRLLDPVLP